MDELVMAGGFHSGSAAGIGDPDASTHHRHRHYLPHPPPSSPPHPHHMMHPMPPAIFEAPAAQKGIGNLISPSAASDDDEDPGDAADEDDGGKSKKGSPWHRMKWTDDMVRLLIAIVSYVGDDGAPEAAAADGPARRRPGAALQKKGKWKTVSRLMLEKGCYVSPQQCEDKFNDLNKRYKRLNEILGRGTTCEVVENAALLDSMAHVTPKAKEDVRKILSSKHLFYQEMCAYHNGPRIPNSHDFEFPGATAPKDGSGSKDDDHDDEDEDDDDGEEGSEEYGKTVRNNLWVEINGVLQDKTKSSLEQLEWIRERAMLLLEERVGIEAEALELEKRKFKWQRFRSKKDREMERMRLENERLILENERMAMQVRQKELELGHGASGESIEPAGFRMDREQRRDLMELN